MRLQNGILYNFFMSLFVCTFADALLCETRCVTHFSANSLTCRLRIPPGKKTRDACLVYWLLCLAGVVNSETNLFGFNHRQFYVVYCVYP